MVDITCQSSSASVATIMTTQALPLSLLLLVHLHILEFAYVNSSEYDHNVFNPHVRSLSERTKSMEDVCYFLVGKLERRAQLKQVCLHSIFFGGVNQRISFATDYTADSAFVFCRSCPRILVCSHQRRWLSGHPSQNI